MKEISAADLKNTVANAVLPTLVDIYTPHCGPCRLLSPVLDELAAEFAGKIDFVKINALADDESTKTCGELGVRNVPALIIFKEGTEIARRTGSASKSDLSAWIASNV
jgi:thioredoxin 1